MADLFLQGSPCQRYSFSVVCSAAGGYSPPTSNERHLQNQKIEPQNTVRSQTHVSLLPTSLLKLSVASPLPSPQFENVLPLLGRGAPGADDGHHRHHHHGDDADGDDDDDEEVAVLLGRDAAVGRVHLPDGRL